MSRPWTRRSVCSYRVMRMCKVTAVVECEYSEKAADAIAMSLQPDNKEEGGTSVRTFRKGATLVTEIESTSLPKLLSVLDDLLRCLSVCDRLLSTTEASSAPRQGTGEEG